MSPTIFVTAATGTLGKALALHLIKIGWGVHATTRDLASPAAKELISAGVKLSQGDWDNKEILRDAIAGCDGLFLNLLPSPTYPGPEVRQGKNLIEAAKAAGVKHAVYVAGVPATRENLEVFGTISFGPAFILNKAVVEDAVREAGFEAYTILRPGILMANWLAPKIGFQAPGLAETGTFATAFRPDTLIMAIDDLDFAVFTTAAFKDPARFHAQSIGVVSDVITVQEILKLLSDATGRKLEAYYMSDEEVKIKAKGNPSLEAQILTRSVVNYFDIAETREWGVPLHTFKEYLEREKASVQQTYNRF